MSGAMMALVNNTVAAFSGPTPGSIYFPTTSSRVTLAPGIVVGGTYQSPFTVEGWFYSGDTPGTDSGPVLLSTDTASSTPAYAKALTINVTSTTQIVVDSNGATATTFNLAQTLIANAWYYVAVSRDASGFLQVWLGKQGDASAAASTSGRFNCNADTSGWALTGLSNCIGAFVPAGRYSANDYISGIRVTNTNLYTTTDATIPMPTQTFGYVNGILFLQSPDDLSDLTGYQTLTSVGSAAYSATGPSIAIQPYTGFTTTELQLYYNPDDRSSYPGSGTTINNLEATALPGTMSNITFTDPYFAYNGTSSTVSIADNAVLEPSTGDFSLETWVYYSVITGSTRTFVSKTNNGGLAANWSYGMRTLATGATYFEVGNGTTSVSSPTYTVTTGTWYQIVGVWTNVASNSIELYINGASQGSNAHAFASVNNSTNPLYLGSYNGGEFSQWFNGRIGITRYYNTALTASQVLQNYNANKAVYGL
jgi:hypothetical protein